MKPDLTVIDLESSPRSETTGIGAPASTECV